MLTLEAPAPLRLLGCILGGHTYAIDMTRIRGLHGADQLTVDKNPLPVFDLAERLGLPRTAMHEPRHLMRIGEGADGFGLLVDRVMPLPSALNDAIYPVPRGASPAIRGMVRVGLDWVPLLDVDRLFSEQAIPAPAAVTPRRPARPHALAGPGRLVSFALGETRPRERPWVFALTIGQVLEVRDRAPAVDLPRSPPALTGMIDWQERPIALIDPARCVNSPPLARQPRTRVIVAAPPGSPEPVGLLIRPAVRVLRMPLAHQPRQRPLPFDADLAACVVELADETLVLLDLAAVAARCVRPCP